MLHISLNIEFIISLYFLVMIISKEYFYYNNSSVVPYKYFSSITYKYSDSIGNSWVYKPVVMLIFYDIILIRVYVVIIRNTVYPTSLNFWFVWNVINIVLFNNMQVMNNENKKWYWILYEHSKDMHCQIIQDNDGAGLSHFIVNLKL